MLYRGRAPCPVPGASELAEYNVHGVEMPDPSPISTPITPPNDVSNAQLVQWAFERINAKDVESLRNFFWTADSTAHAVTNPGRRLNRRPCSSRLFRASAADVCAAGFRYGHGQNGP